VSEGRALAVLARHTNLATLRTPSRLELTYLATADALARMIAAGEFPTLGAPTGQRRGAPRVGDGVIRLDAYGTVDYASPNAISAIHRLGHVGDVVGTSLAQITTEVLRDEAPVDERLALVVTGRAPWRTEVESRGTSSRAPRDNLIFELGLFPDGPQDAALPRRQALATHFVRTEARKDTAQVPAALFEIPDSVRHGIML